MAEVKNLSTERRFPAPVDIPDFEDPGTTLPKKFDASKMYRVQVKAMIPHPSVPHHMLRPQDDVVVPGDIAESIRAFLTGAKEA